MPSPNEAVLLFEIEEGVGVVLKPSSIPVLLEYDNIAPGISCRSSDLELEDQLLDIEVNNKPDLLINAGEQGPAGAPGTPGAVTINVDTALVQTGRLVYADANLHAAHTDARTFLPALALGAFAGVQGRVTAIGRVDNVLFTDASPTPAPGQRVWLARADEEVADGAAGKVTVTVPTTGFAVPAGSVMSVPGDFATSRRAVVMVRIGEVIKRA